MRLFLTGNEAIALGFYFNGGTFASGYPGTPSTEILEKLSEYRHVIHSEWAPNEKVAVESVIGASFAGLRSIAVMKHVGVNVATDPIFTVAYTGINAGMIIVTADDPGIHSSQNEQDNRNYSRFAKIPMLEPSSSQECYDFIEIAFKISEYIKLPVFIRLTTRICHSKTIVETNQNNRKEIHFPIERSRRFDPIPIISRQLHKTLENKIQNLSENTNQINLFKLEKHSNKIGIITSGMSYNYVKEAFGNLFSILKLNLIFPIPKKIVKDFANSVEQLYVIEELDPFLEEEILKLGIKCIGKAVLPRTSELSTRILKSAFQFQLDKFEENTTSFSPKVSLFCKGCFYNVFFNVLSNYKDIIISSDIGCYSMSGGEPFNAKDIAICMGAGFSLAHGIQIANNYLKRYTRVIGIMGDSTFFHSGISSLINCIYNKSNPVLIILDNQSTSMTGFQDNPGTEKNLMQEKVKKIDILNLLKALNVQHTREFNPFSSAETFFFFFWALTCKELVVLIAKGHCLLKLSKEKRKKND